jgi:RNA 2',3'-cyclic 3'-phosphodiesterase
MARSRIFIGIEIDDAMREQIATLQAVLAESGATVKWVDRQNLHVTLLFLGDVDDRDLYAISKIVSTASRREPPFRLSVSGVGAFPNLRRPKTIWAGITEGTETLQRIHVALEEPLIDLGCYRQEERSYTPHLTLGRTQSEVDSNVLSAELPKHVQWDGGETMIEELVIFSSELRRSGPEYTVVARAELGT